MVRRRMLAAALEAEVAVYIAAHTDQLDDDGRRGRRRAYDDNAE
jgi:hypothetical protein